MGKSLRNLIVALGVCAVLGAGAWLLLRQPTPAEAEQSPTAGGYAATPRTAEQVSRVTVRNAHAAYTVEQGEGGLTLGDLPPEAINPEYTAMLLEECASLQYEELVEEQPADHSPYGLSEPEATVDITYADGSALQLLLGAQEPVSGGRYFKTDDSAAVLLMKRGRTIRFLMPVENYINYVIIPPEAGLSPLNELLDIRISGENFSEPVELEAPLAGREDLQRQGIRFGAFTHLIVSPGLHEGDATALTTLADQLLGLISEGIEAYNCTPEELAAYGFEEPYLKIDFNYKNGENADVVPYTLRVCRQAGGYIAAVDGRNIVYRILDQAFLHLQYENLISRWFASPLVSDVAALELTDAEGTVRYELSGKNAKELVVTRGGQAVDTALFRRLFNLVTGAAREGGLLAEPPALAGEPVLTLRYSYRDAQKADDVLEFYPADARRQYVSVNGVCEFAARAQFSQTVREASRALLAGESFSTDWQ